MTAAAVRDNASVQAIGKDVEGIKHRRGRMNELDGTEVRLADF
ncbi:MAG: hypothetical protein U0168_21190 [Nannocystaceae bacterium]